MLVVLLLLMVEFLWHNVTSTLRGGYWIRAVYLLLVLFLDMMLLLLLIMLEFLPLSHDLLRIQLTRVLLVSRI